MSAGKQIRMKRIIYENSQYVALAPFAPRAPFETWILPKRHESNFQPPNKNFSSLAEILQVILRQMDKRMVHLMRKKLRLCPACARFRKVSKPGKSVRKKYGGREKTLGRRRRA